MENLINSVTQNLKIVIGIIFIVIIFNYATQTKECVEQGEASSYLSESNQTKLNQANHKAFLLCQEQQKAKLVQAKDIKAVPAPTEIKEIEESIKALNEKLK
jgi:hypothetical protein